MVQIIEIAVGKAPQLFKDSDTWQSRFTVLQVQAMIHGRQTTVCIIDRGFFVF